ncbi:Uma2 family endonuclease [Streptomyces sp. YC504]|uniref:Uma2 family endonuclease n=1 Tax=Streptomyces mesophilus TaxID=1775132 RepID=A0A6G4XJP9_9ACTN|nr:Uma2 family endonuclease [Streptomyces mesophilus]NGO77789.1 Uma2 family endonuclease [Streptomyces mesophilus]
MTAMAEHASRASLMSVEEFEALAAFAGRELDTVRLEFINGRVGFKGMTDGDHNEIIRWLQKRCMQAQADLWLYAGGELGLKVEAYRQGRAKPDAVLAPEESFAGQGDWADCTPVLMAVEVTSYDSDTDRRDRKEKPLAYGEAGIPFYLLIDRDQCTVTLHSGPDPDGGYRDTHKVKFGGQLTIPDPVGITLDTEILKNYVR